MKGIILAGGSGTRLHPLTIAVSKHLLPVYDRPMIEYPLKTLIHADIQEILLITNEKSLAAYNELLGDGSNWGIHIQYKVQSKPEGVAQALTLGEDFLHGEGCVLILGDNIFYGQGLSKKIKSAVKHAEQEHMATIFACPVLDPRRYGIVELDNDGKFIVSLEEKPQKPRSKCAITGLYVYDCRAVQFAKEIGRSIRGEFEITDVNRKYWEQGSLMVEMLDEDSKWFDVGTVDSLFEASVYMRERHKERGKTK